VVHDLSADDVRSGLRELAAQRHLVLDADDEILMAHPFSAVPLGLSAMGGPLSGGADAAGFVRPPVRAETTACGEGSDDATRSARARIRVAARVVVRRRGG
jgi:hypothetical protein